MVRNRTPECVNEPIVLTPKTSNSVCIVRWLPERGYDATQTSTR